MKVKNKRCIRHVSWRQLTAAKTRNLIAIFAITLTTLLFTSLFTIALSLNSSYEEYSFRQIGGYSHGSFKEVTEDQIEALSGHKKVKEYGLRTVCGLISDGAFAKTPAEVSWMDENCTKWSYATPTTGRMPETSAEIAMDTASLEKLGVPPELGAQVVLSFQAIYGQQTREETGTFTLVGFWDYDGLMPVHYINVTRDYVTQLQQDILASGGETFRTDMNVMLSSSVNIEGVMQSIDRDLGYQWEDREADNCVRIGCNWGYTASDTHGSLDAESLLSIGALLALVVLTGYLIIYNIFQISVSNDVRFYGLLKTIGTTPRQIRRMVRLQAMYLCIVGIPLGCGIGYGLGCALLPAVISSSSITTSKASASPVIFIASALFALLTVLLSCARPGRMAAKISPVEAVRYTENTNIKGKRRSGRGAGIGRMALANLNRNRAKTALVIVSLTLAVVLLNCVFMFTRGFDMERYVSSFSVSDFVVGPSDYFRYRSGTMPQESIDEIRQNTNASLGGVSYTLSGARPTVWVSEELFRSTVFSDPDQAVLATERRGNLLGANLLLQGLDPALLDKLILREGDLAPLLDPDQHAIAIGAGEEESDYMAPKVGDTLTVTYADEAQYCDIRTGEPAEVDTPSQYIERRVLKSHDVDYTVCAVVGIPYNMSFRFIEDGAYSAVVTSDALRQDAANNMEAMFYMFDSPNETEEAAAEAFLANYTAGEASGLMYESKALLRADFENFRDMFLLIGGMLCFIVGLVGVLNFFNAVLTGILTRRREFAMLQSVGMTGRQLKRMLIYEGIFYALGAGLLSLLLSLVMNPLAAGVLENIFWFFTYRFTLLPVFVMAPAFVLLGALLPLAVYRFTAKKSIVERLREAE